ncbi:MAG: hypothetical protein ABL953_14655 [Ilumatobacteraceae bacterium]
MNEQAEERTKKRSGWNADPTMDYPVGPDDAGNAVMHGIGFLVRGWRWVVGKIKRV